MCFSDFGHDVICVDKDAAKLAKLRAGEVPIYEPGLDDLMAKNVAAGRLTFSGDLKAAVDGAFLEVHVATSLEECERRDRKGLYKLARSGKIKEFTGISDPYDVPETPELRLETESVPVDNCAHQVILKLESLGLIKA